MATSVVSGRVDEKVKRQAEISIRKAGLTPNLVIQNIWRSIAETGEIPPACWRQGPSLREPGALERLECFLTSLPTPNTAFADASDDDVLATRADGDA